MSLFNRKTAIIDFLKANSGKEFSNLQLAKWLINTYPEEIEQKMQASNDKRLLNTTNKVERKKAFITIYRQELNRTLRPIIQKIEPKVKITAKGRWAKYCYVNNTDNIVDKFKFIKTLENHKQQEFTHLEIVQLLLSTGSK